MNNKTDKIEYVGINFRIPKDIYDEMTLITDKTEKSTAAFIAYAVEFYLNKVTGRKLSKSDTIKIDKFAYELNKTK